MLYKRVSLKNFSKFTDKHKRQSSEGALSRDVPKNLPKFTEKHLCWSLFLIKLEFYRQSSEGALSKNVPKNLPKFTEKHLCWSLFLIKLEFSGSATLLKKTLRQVLSCEIWKIFKSNYFEEHLWTTGSKLSLKRDTNTGVFLWVLWITPLFYKQLGSGLSPQSCLYFQGFLLNGCLVVWQSNICLQGIQ